MNPTTRFLLAATGLACIVLVTIAGCRQVLQHRATYAGGLTFVGAADGLAGSRYYRMFLWRAPDYTDALPAISVHIGDVAHGLGTLTPELFVGLGGTLDTGALYDSEGRVLQYRFEGGRLTWISLDTPQRATAHAPGGNVQPGVFALSRGGAPVTLPASLGALRAALGSPEKTALVFAQ